LIIYFSNHLFIDCSVDFYQPRIQIHQHNTGMESIPKRRFQCNFSFQQIFDANQNINHKFIYKEDVVSNA